MLCDWLTVFACPHAISFSCILNDLPKECQWFLKNVFHVPKFAPGLLLLKISNLNSIESEIDLKKLLFLGPLITEPNMSAVVKGLFCSQAASFF